MADTIHLRPTDELAERVLLPGDPGVAAGGAPTRFNHVSPRVGMAWTPFPDGRTVIHAAAGVFYGSIGGNLFTIAAEDSLSLPAGLLL